MQNRSGIVSLAVDFPAMVRTNDYWRTRHPDVVASAADRALARMWVANPDETHAPAAIFDEEMAPYLNDPFRGAVERRALAESETILSVEARVARNALAKAGIRPQDVDLLISSAFVTDYLGIGHAAYLAKELAIGGTAWNLETACSSGIEAVRTANALVRSGEHKTVLVVVSCMYSRVSDPEDTITWSVGDGAAAFVVRAGSDGAEVLGARMKHTGDTCGAMYFESVPDRAGGQLVMRASREGGKHLREASANYLLECCHGALEAANVRLEDIAFFAFNTPTAWYAKFCARALGVSFERTIDTFPRYGNMGPVLMPVNLYEAARQGRVNKGDLVLLYSIGSVASAGAMVVRWGDVALGEAPVEATGRE